jgi:diguanylate cyclase (GGDEF)-like protein
LGEAEAKLKDLKFELAVATAGHLELVVKLADAEQEIKRLGINLVPSQKEAQHESSHTGFPNATASGIQLPIEHLPRLIESSSEAFIILEGERITYCNEAAAQLLGLTHRAQIHGQTLADLSPVQQPGGQLSKELAKEQLATAGLRGKLDFDWLFSRQDNRKEIAMEIVLTALPFGDTAVLLISARDATVRHQQAKNMEGLAFFDVLTGLPNRRLMLDRLTQAMTQSQRSGRHGAVVFLDLDHFKRLNDQYGHACGDEVLRQTALRVQRCIRAEDTVSRQGGDEFVILMVELNEDAGVARSHAEHVAGKIRKALEKPHKLTQDFTTSPEHEVEFSCPASLGVTLFQGERVDLKSVLKAADSAMYRAKSAGGNRVVFAAPV